MRYPSLFTRLVANTDDPISDTACWIWNGPTRRHGGGNRPAICIRTPKGPRNFNAARVMVELFHGPLAPGVEASHLCSDSWLCVNPDHLIPETKRRNLQRRDGWNVPIEAYAGDCNEVRFEYGNDASVNNITLGEDLLLTAPSIAPTLRPCAERFGAMEQTA